MKLIESYLFYLYLQEREWNDPTENPDSFDINRFKDILGDLGGIIKMRQIRHALQPSLYNIYIKNSIGDYKGRPDMMNTKTMHHLGIDDFKGDIKDLIRKIKFAQKIKSKANSHFQFKPDSETNDPPGDGGDSGDGDGGDSGGDGGGDGGGGGGGSA